MNEFNVCITFDTDADPNIENVYNKNSISFKSLDLGLEKIYKKFQEIEKKIKQKIPITWFIRADNQIQHEYGNYDFLFKKYSFFWEKVIKQNHEIQWHAHIYELVNKQWIFPRNDEYFFMQIKEIYNYLKKNTFSPQCIRMGEAYMNNNIMNFIRNLGILADSSAIPGRLRRDHEKIFDWSNSQNFPYHPSISNYQDQTHVSGKFLEIPMNTIKIKTSYDKEPILRYVNLSFIPELMYQGLNDFIVNKETLVSITHPFELFKNFKINKGLISYNIDTLEKNILSLVEICKKNNKKINFLKISEIINKY